MLILKPNCECCNTDLPPNSKNAFICTFECTFCRDCTTSTFHHICPNCSGNLVERPIRPPSALINNPASVKRVLKPHQACNEN